MLMLDEAVLLAISTIRGVHNFFSRLRNLKDDKGEAVFNTVDFRVECKRPECEGRAENCPHILSQLPSHLSADKAERVKLLMSGEGDLYLQEIQNIESDPTEPMFGRHDIDWLFDPHNRFKDGANRMPKYIVIAVDPNGGGLSNYAIVSVAIYQSFTVVRTARDTSGGWERSGARGLPRLHRRAQRPWPALVRLDQGSRRARWLRSEQADRRRD